MRTERSGQLQAAKRVSSSPWDGALSRLHAPNLFLGVLGNVKFVIRVVVERTRELSEAVRLIDSGQIG